MDKNLMWLAKKLKNAANDLSKLSETEKKHVIERLDSISSKASTELYNALNEYMRA